MTPGFDNIPDPSGLHSSGKPLDNRTMPSATIIPVLIYDDVVQAIEWLCSTFGFTERWRIGTHRAQLSLGDGAIAISERQPAWGETPPTSTIHQSVAHSLLVRIPNVYSHYEHARQHGAYILHPPTDFPYGERQYSAIDIGGHRWTFSQSIQDLAPEDWGATTPLH